MAADRTLVWYGPDGSPLNLTDITNGFALQWALTGFMRPTYRVATRTFPGRPGSVLTSVIAAERTFEVGLAVFARGRAEFRERALRLVRAMQPTAGMGRLVVTEATGESRSIECICQEGLEGEETPSAGGSNWWKLNLSFFAPSPYARAEVLSVPWSLGPSTSSWFPEIPIRLSGGSGVGGRQVVLNPGDVQAFPVITVHGPGRDLSVTNRTTGEGLTLGYTIPASEGPGALVVIDTRPGEQSIRDGYGVNLFEYLTDDDPTLWSLAPGVNDVEVSLIGAGASTRVTVEFEPLYESL